MIKHLDRNEITKVYGISGGALCAVWLVCASDDQGFHFICNQYVEEWEAQVERMGGRLALARSMEYHRSLLERCLPQNAHELCSGRVSIALTNTKTRQIDSISEFDTREELISILIAAMTIPYINAFLPAKVRGKRYMDAGFISNQIICCPEVIVCSPFKSLTLPWTARAPEVIRCIMGKNPMIQAFNPHVDIRKQVRMGFRFTREFFEVGIGERALISLGQEDEPKKTSHFS